ncbi:MAG: sugar phosphate isomerase/epimerase [Cyclobacteriaceae bacterium]|nr:sugar phosphate isomerase/epimerase [Cyclobacteriaceae bacterium]
MKNILVILLAFGVALISCDKPAERYGGVTLYTVRNNMKANPDSTLQALADIGYRNIEVAAGYSDGKYFGMAPADFKKKLTDLGFTPLSAHQNEITFDNVDQIIADVKAAGFQYLVIPVPPMGHFRFNAETRTLNMSDSVEFVTDVLNRVGKKCTQAGIKMLYHNHDFEFKPNANGIIPMDYFLEHTDPAHVNFQLDLYWITKAGGDPLAYFKKYPGRFKIWHIKDMDSQGRFAPVGTGTIDFKGILAEKELAGMEYFIAEQDMTFDGMTPIQSVTISYKGMKDLGFY